MKKNTIILIIYLSIFIYCCNSCPDDNGMIQDNNIKSYDPIKAGATIVDKFDITNLIFKEKGNYQQKSIMQTHKYTIYSDNLYIMGSLMIQVFDKNTLEKINDYKVILPSEYNFLLDRDLICFINDFTVINNHVFILLCDFMNPPYKNYFFIIDLESNIRTNYNSSQPLQVYAEYIDENKLNFKFPDGMNSNIGVNIFNNKVWFRIISNNNSERFVIFNYFNYNRDSKSFYLLEENIFSIESNILKQDIHNKVDSMLFLHDLCIYDNEIWNVYFYSNPRGFIGGGREPFITIMDKRSFDNILRTIKIIDIEYLGFGETGLQTCVYDPPFIWILVDNDDRFLMLKLLPNE